MLNSLELEEIKEKLEQSQNPLFFFDNDADGLCSFLILQRSIGRGKGIAIKSFPELKSQYLKKIEELNPDTIFILDKPLVEKEFIDGVTEKNIPIIWIDHHEVQTDKNLIEKTFYYNSFPSAEPVTYLAQKISNRTEDLWLAMIGCIGDVYMPEFAKEFEKQFPELINSKLSAFEALNKSEIGKFARMFNFGLMDSTTNVINLIRYLTNAKGPYDLLEENPKTRQFHKRYQDLSKQYHRILEKAEAQIDLNSEILFFTYSGGTSMSSEVANTLYFKYNNKTIVVAYTRPEKVNLSIRGKNAKKITLEAIKNIDGASGGGHEEACGAMIPIGKLEEFKRRIYEEVNTLSV